MSAPLPGAVFPQGGSPPLPTGFISVPLQPVRASPSDPGSPTARPMYGASPPHPHHHMPYGASPPHPHVYGSSPPGGRPWLGIAFWVNQCLRAQNILWPVPTHRLCFLLPPPATVQGCQAAHQACCTCPPALAPLCRTPTMGPTATMRMACTLHMAFTHSSSSSSRQTLCSTWRACPCRSSSSQAWPSRSSRGRAQAAPAAAPGPPVGGPRAGRRLASRGPTVPAAPTTLPRWVGACRGGAWCCLAMQCSRRGPVHCNARFCGAGLLYHRLTSCLVGVGAPQFAFDLEEAQSGRPDARCTVMIRK